MSFERIALLGDAACLTRPHATASTYKSFVDAKVLAENLESTIGDVKVALFNYNNIQLPLGIKWVNESRSMGNLDCYIRPAT